MGDPGFHEFYCLLRNCLSQSLQDWCNNNYEGIYSYFNALSGDDQRQILNLLRSRGRDFIVEIRSNHSRDSITIVSIFQILEAITQSVTELEETENYRALAASRFLPLSPGSQASYELQETEIYPAASHFRPLSQGSPVSYDPWHLELSRAIEKVEPLATFLISWVSSLKMFSNINFSHFEAGTLHHTQRTLPDQHNSHLTDGAGTQYDLMPVPSHHIPPDYGHVSINMNNTNLNYSTNTQSYSQRSIASSHGIFQATEISPYGDPGASSSSTAAASHGEARATRGIFQATEISPYGDPGVSSSTAATSHGEMSYSLQSHSQRPAASHNNPPGHDAVSNVPVGHSGILQATEISPYGDPGASTSSTAAASHGEMSNSLQSHSRRPTASHNNPPGHDAVINIPGEGEFTSGHQTIPAEARATRDGETAGHSKFFEILLPVNFKYAYKAGDILKSTYHILPPSIKTSGYLTVAIAFVAALSSLAGFSLSTFRPSTLPFGWNPQLMLQIMHISTVFSLGYAFIGIMCHEFLRDDPIILWMVEGLAYAVLTAVLVVIIRRR